MAGVEGDGKPKERGYILRLKSVARQAEKWLHELSRTNKLVAVLGFCSMAVLTTCDVTGRYLLSRPILGTLEFVEVLMVLVVYGIFAYVAEEDFNIRVDIITVRLSKRVQALLHVFSSLGSVFVMGLITWQMGFRTWDLALREHRNVSDTAPWPLWPFIAIATVGCGVLVLELFAWFLRSMKNAMIRS